MASGGGASFLAVLLFVCLPLSAYANSYEFYVNPTNSTGAGDGSQSSPFSSISQALAIVTLNDTVAIHLAAGVYTGPENLGLTYEAGTIDVIGPTAGGVEDKGIAVLDCEGGDLGMDMQTGYMRLLRLHFQGCVTGVFVGSGTNNDVLSCTFDDISGTAVVLDNVGYMYMEDTKFTNVLQNSISGRILSIGLTLCTFTGQEGGIGGGGVALTRVATGGLTSCTFSHVGGFVGSTHTNQAFTADSGLWSMMKVYVDQCTLTAAEGSLADSDSSGGAFKLSDYSGTPNPATLYTMWSVTFINNRAVGGFGGALALGAGANVTMSEMVFDGNTASDGGAIYMAANSVATVSDASFNYNAADDAGGAIYADQDSKLYLANTTFAGNTAQVASADVSCCSDGSSCSAEVYVGDGMSGVSNSTSDCEVSDWGSDGSNDNDPGPKGWVVFLVFAAVVLCCIGLGVIAVVAKKVQMKRRNDRVYDIVD